MRSSKSRSRNKSNRNRNNPGNIINRVFDSSGPEGKVRGTPQQIIEKYSQLARDAFLSNDRVAGENFQQHAEHYTRILAEAQREVDARRQQAEQQNRERQQREKDERERKADTSADVVDTPADATLEGAEQPDLIESPEDSGLVETPESKPKKAPAKPRKPRRPAKPKTDVKSDDQGGGAQSQPEAPDAPEAAE
ncbi:DUF4167 domain-containing protein [Aliiroseovarius crassostreae]|uniref:DUF4167 domain-containing protein n=1 Tax=Aliiroseovarius crassostreae TaxID=154981 RepID=A0A9Q9H9H4_9RHOB|nr:DUF4167 domain-containing protein [Aliiroseovarius crassostreae]UWP93644.1 DUF4167 domain-containing protein [Aliiroseovarius crassostreae]UWP94139.1 DUF4167 domain-containing protein [Aliiroseovarius crassostreae]UWP99948.1 DUF4167 domain-containing protein [Aliiroseovarius crassostreae]